MWIDFENILRDNDEVSELALFQRAFRFFAPPCKRRAERVAFHRLRDASIVATARTRLPACLLWFAA